MYGWMDYIEICMFSPRYCAIPATGIELTARIWRVSMSSVSCAIRVPIKSCGGDHSIFGIQAYTFFFFFPPLSLSLSLSTRLSPLTCTTCTSDIDAP